MVVCSKLPVKGGRMFHSRDPYWLAGSNVGYQKWNEPPWWTRFSSWSNSANWTSSGEDVCVCVHKIDSRLARLMIHKEWNLLRWCSAPSGVMGLPGSPDVKASKRWDESNTHATQYPTGSFVILPNKQDNLPTVVMRLRGHQRWNLPDHVMSLGSTNWSLYVALTHWVKHPSHSRQHLSKPHHTESYLISLVLHSYF